MRIRHWNKRATKKYPKEKGYMINVTRKEALVLIESLSHQLSTEHCNGGRSEHYTRDNSYFSIAVDDKLEAEE